MGKKEVVPPTCDFEWYDNNEKKMVRCGKEATFRVPRLKRHACNEHAQYVSMYERVSLLKNDKGGKK